MKAFLRIFWIVFAWFLVVFLIASVIEGLIYSRISTFGTNEIFSIIYLPMVVAIIGYAHRWRIWKSGIYFWRAYFFIFIASGIAQLWINNWIPSQLKYDPSPMILIGIVIPIILVILMVVGVYLYAFRFLKQSNIQK